MKKYALGLLAGLVLSASMMTENTFPISRKQGSGTCGASVKIFEIQKRISNKKADATTQKAEVTNSTGVVLATVANSKSSIGYISLGFLNDNVRTLQINGVAPSVENISNKGYRVSRPFNVVTRTGNPLIKDFLKYSTSVEAKVIVEEAGYIATAKENSKSLEPEGRLIVAGSNSVTPLMERLAESYRAVNPNTVVEIQQSDSTTNVNSVIEGIADIGMVSREVKDGGLKKGVTPLVLAIDGLVVIVNKSNGVGNLSKDSIRKIFMEEITDWQDVRQKSLTNARKNL